MTLVSLRGSAGAAFPPAGPTAFAPSTPLRRAARPSAHVGVLVEAALCVVPAMIAVGFGDPPLGARWLFGSLTLCLCANAVFGYGPTPLLLLVATLPATMFLRNLLLYNGPTLLFAAGAAWLVLRSSPARAALFRPAFALTALAAFAYWAVTWLRTGEYDVNFRLFEMLDGVAAVMLLAPYRHALATALLGMAGSLAAMGLALLPYGDRLGYAQVGGERLGNPIAYGVPLALLLTLSVAEGGRWLWLERSRAARAVVGAGVGLLLVLSTSRGGWLVAATCLTLVLLLDRKGRRPILVLLAVLAVAVGGVAQTTRGDTLATWADRTFSESRSLSNRTSGRSDQWMIFPAVMRDAPLWGFGPGSGGKVYAHYSALDPRVQLVPGEELPWHSLYQHLAVETGAIGVAAIALLLGTLLRNTVAAWRASGEVIPLVGVMAFAVIALTVSGMDAASGMFLGLAFTAPSPARARAPAPVTLESPPWCDGTAPADLFALDASGVER